MASTSSEKEAREDHTLEMREEAKEMRMERQLAEKTVRRPSNMKTHTILKTHFQSTYFGPWNIISPFKLEACGL